MLSIADIYAADHVVVYQQPEIGSIFGDICA